MLQVLEITSEKESNPHPVWVYRPLEQGFSIEVNLLQSMEISLSKLATNFPDNFSKIASQLQLLDYDTVQYLLIRAYAANGKRFADEASNYLCQKTERLECGYSSSSHWATRQLLEAITPHCSCQNINQLEEAIMSYYSECEKSSRTQFFGYAQFTLLTGITPSRRTEKASRRVAEWQRKFGRQSPEAPCGNEGGFIGSPIPEYAVNKMTDQQWLNAIKKYKAEIILKQNGKSVEGAYQLSNILESQVKQEPLRFAKLVLKFPDNAHSAYFDAILRGISDADLAVQTVLDVCHHCHKQTNHPHGRWITQPIAKLAEYDLPPELLDMVIWYATKDSDPEKESWRTNGGGIIMAAINSVRGCAAKSMATLIFAKSDRVTYFLPTLKKMVQDPSITVRALVADTLLAILKHNRDLAVQLFQQLCDTEDVLLGTYHVERFLYYGVRTHFKALKPILDRMLDSEIPETATVGARQACLAALQLEEAHQFAKKCLSGKKELRIGAAEIFSANINSTDSRHLCENALKQLFHDSDKEIHAKAATCFAKFEENQLGDYTQLIEEFVKSPAYPTQNHNLILAFEKTTAKLPEVTLLVCQQFIKVAGKKVGDISTNIAFDANRISQLLLRIYSQSKNSEFQSRCLDIIDKMAAENAYSLKDALSLYER